MQNQALKRLAERLGRSQETNHGQVVAIQLVEVGWVEVNASLAERPLGKPFVSCVSTRDGNSKQRGQTASPLIREKPLRVTRGLQLDRR